MYFFVSEGEDLSAFVELRLQLTLQYAPCGPDQEDCVLTMAKCSWRKQRYQQFQLMRAMSAKFDSTTGAYDQRNALQALLEALQKVEQKIEVEPALQGIDAGCRDYLARCCSKSRFKTTHAWIRALLREIQGVLLPAVSRFGDPPKEILLSRSAAVLTDDILERELAYERTLDAEFDRALERLFRLKAAKRKIDFWERRRWQSSLRLADNPTGVDDAEKK
jgi:hypothetical protein